MLHASVDESEKIYQQVSNGNNAYSFTALNGGNPVLTSTVGTKGVRDSYLVASPDRSEFWAIGTDLNTHTQSWSDAVTHGSKSIVIWHTTDLVNWDTNYLAQVDDDTAGMVWAPSAVYDPNTKQYFVFWGSQLFAEDDPNHTNGPVTKTLIRYATTTDFKTFSSPQTYINGGDQDRLDQEFQSLGGNSYARFTTAGGAGVIEEISQDGLLGTWNRVGGSSNYINTQSPREGPTSFQDNQDSSEYHLWLDAPPTDGYETYSTNGIQGGSYPEENVSGFPSGMRQGSVLPITQSEYE
ncbi:uncharacterized protein FA14DRAFT_167836 [Meira miltonrushii]|uniref:Arabinanase/levansucrase/invertase n=1 Tax=Meira miltonrushii TaxID=1280837 RepID=A0A316VE43_9BASI|nr:uncharacterized protein FA14DRAFT_167836 [Meira miltonrushii]PWN35909.1 hypothetical protein FA14DRAFT_167836 [Meira miltonrushii]